MFHACLHPLPVGPIPRRRGLFDGVPCDALVFDPAAHATFDCTFEEAVAALETLPRLFVEPDGSFFWVGGAGDTAWQLDGVLYDRAGRLLYVELKGDCSNATLDRLLTAVGWPAVAVMFQIVQAGLYLDEATFRRRCLRSSG